MSHRVLSSILLSMLHPANSSSFLLRLDVAKRPEQTQIVDAFQGSREDERGTQRQRLEQGSRQGGETACATVRVAFVTLAAAVRSSGSTTATTYDCRAGTSICPIQSAGSGVK